MSNQSVIHLDGNINWEMGVDRFHLVAISVGDALHHVLNVTDDGADGRNIFAVSKPFLSLKSVQMGEIDGLMDIMG